MLPPPFRWVGGTHVAHKLRQSTFSSAQELTPERSPLPGRAWGGVLSVCSLVPVLTKRLVWSKRQCSPGVTAYRGGEGGESLRNVPPFPLLPSPPPPQLPMDGRPVATSAGAEAPRSVM
ncbi:unnamed protein product [Boreogadus saida]